MDDTDGFHKVVFETDQPEILIGLLSAYPFEAFQELPGRVEAWLAPGFEIEECKQILENALNGFFRSYAFDHIPDENWNANWEARFDPVVVGDFCIIRAPFHESEEAFDYEIAIEPKMAFGTGHHQTTSLMITAMHKIHLEDKRVLDFGCGTGILGIFAAMRKASTVVCVDIEETAVQSTLVNARANGVEIDVRAGSVEAVKGDKFDVIVANISRNTLMFLMDEIAGLAVQGGSVLLAGFLEDNVAEITNRALESGLHFRNKSMQGEWICLEFGLV